MKGCPPLKLGGERGQSRYDQQRFKKGTIVGLDIYVGSLVRYYVGNWETVVSKWARKQGVVYATVRPSTQESDVVTDETVIMDCIRLWRYSLSKGLSKFLVPILEWEERPDTPYFTDKPDWDGYACLLLMAAHHEHPEMPKPEKATNEWGGDPAFVASTADDFKSRFNHILLPELWLPVDFGSVFRSEDLAGQEVPLGSSMELLRELEILNSETVRGSDYDIAQWIYDGPGSEQRFNEAARFGLAMFLHHARLSVKHRLPMKLDY